MGWYIKLDLTDQERHRRRSALDGTGFISCAAPFIVLLGLAAIRAYRRKHSTGSSFPPTIGPLEWRVLHAPAVAAFPEMGSLGVWGGTLGYVVWQLYLAMSGTNEDYLHLTKAFGTLAVSNLPLHFFLAGKSRTFIHRWLLHCSHTSINIFHRWLGRLIFTFVAFHAILYLNYFFATDQVDVLSSADILCGITAMTMLGIIFTTSLSLIRHTPSSYFTVFYFTHIILALLLFPILWMHVSHCHPYLILSALLWLWDYTSRWFATRWGHADVKLLPGGRTAEVDITLNPPEKISIPTGAHIFVTVPRLHRLRGKMRSNPFSVASFSDTEQRIKLVMRVRDGFTKSLVQLAQSTRKAASRDPDADDDDPSMVHLPASIFLPSQPPFPNFLQYARILFIAGGVGGSFCVPWVKHLHTQPPTGTTIRFVWAVSDSSEPLWSFDDTPEDLLHAYASSLELYVTRSHPHPLTTTFSKSGQTEEDQLQAELLPRENRMFPMAFPKENLRRERPNLRRIVEQELESCFEGDDMAVVVCGPEEMSRVVREAVGKVIGNQKNVGVWFWEEGFGY
ncbi:hypothetical protein BDZ91DRAFT_848669 [Kalaharituber pfeilii]|nr:hypothetical protein BDZ91DRAFT_848669 [Kalaharituber pfeilii]